jgi:hypothetical protein
VTYLASSAGALIVDRNTWASRANQAWGPSDVWSSGNSWEYLTGYHGWVGRTYNVGESWESAYNRVYTDRYNEGYNAGYTAGYTAGAASKTTSTVATTPSNGNVVTDTWQQVASLTCPRAGHAGVVGCLDTVRLNTVDLPDNARSSVRIKLAGSVVATGAEIQHARTGSTEHDVRVTPVVWWNGTVANGQVLTLEVCGFNFSGTSMAYFGTNRIFQATVGSS